MKLKLIVNSNTSLRTFSSIRKEREKKDWRSVVVSLTRIEKVQTLRRRWRRSQIYDQRSHLSETMLRNSTRRRFWIWSPWTKLSRFPPIFHFEFFCDFQI